MNKENQARGKVVSIAHSPQTTQLYASLGYDVEGVTMHVIVNEINRQRVTNPAALEETGANVYFVQLACAAFNPTFSPEGQLVGVQVFAPLSEGLKSAEEYPRVIARATLLNFSFDTFSPLRHRRTGTIRRMRGGKGEVIHEASSLVITKAWTNPARLPEWLAVPALEGDTGIIEAVVETVESEAAGIAPGVIQSPARELQSV